MMIASFACRCAIALLKSVRASLMPMCLSNSQTDDSMPMCLGEKRTMPGRRFRRSDLNAPPKKHQRSMCKVVNVTQSIRTAFRAFFARPLRRRSNKTLQALLRSLCCVRTCVEVSVDGIRRETSFSTLSVVDNASMVLIYFVRDQVMVHTSLSRAESHPLLSSAFHGVHANDSCIYGTVFNVSTRIEQPSAVLYILDVPCDAFFIGDWMPSKSESLHDVIMHLNVNHTVFR
jgi:hypothetical protein